MSVDLLRRAAEKLRAHAEDPPHGPWKVASGRTARPGRPYPQLVVNDAAVEVTTCHEGPQFEPSIARYIALMHPPVALLLAALLEEHATAITEFAGIAGLERSGDLTETDEAALAVARAILREESR